MTILYVRFTGEFVWIFVQYYLFCVEISNKLLFLFCFAVTRKWRGETKMSKMYPFLFQIKEIWSQSENCIQYNAQQLLGNDLWHTKFSLKRHFFSLFLFFFLFSFIPSSCEFNLWIHNQLSLVENKWLRLVCKRHLHNSWAATCFPFSYYISTEQISC